MDDCSLKRNSRICKTFLLNVFEDDEANDYDDDVVMEVVHHLLRGKKRRQRIADYFLQQCLHTLLMSSHPISECEERLLKKSVDRYCFKNDHFICIPTASLAVCGWIMYIFDGSTL